MATHANYNVIFSSDNDVWPTPADFFERLDAEFNFGLDVCSSTNNHKAPAYYAIDHPDESRRDGLDQDWAAEAAELGGLGVFCNPPYGSGIENWMRKAHEAAQAGATVVTLVPVRSSSGWWHDLVLMTGAEVRYVRGRLTFGDAKHSAAFSSAVVIYRPTDSVGAPGPTGVMRGKLKKDAQAAAVRELTNRRQASTRRRDTVEDVIAGYIPKKLSSDSWKRARRVVRASVAQTNPANPSLARERLGALTGFLAAEWGATSAPDLSRLLTADSIDAHIATLTSPGRRAANRSHLASVYFVYNPVSAALQASA